MSTSAHSQQVSLSLSLSRLSDTPCPSTAPEVEVGNVSLSPRCPPSLMVVWSSVDPSLLSGPDSVYVIRGQEEGGESDTVEVEYSNNINVSSQTFLVLFSGECSFFFRVV